MTRRVRAILGVALLCVLLAAVASALSASRADPHAATKNHLRAELTHDFPGFDVEITYSRWDPGLSFDAVPFDQYDYRLRLESVPAFEVVGRYTVGNGIGEAAQFAAMRTGLFVSGHLTPEVLTALARVWVAAHPRTAVMIDPLSRTSSTARSPVLQANARQKRFIDRRLGLDNVYAFSTARGLYWMHLDKATGTWTSLGDSAALLGRYAK